MVKALDGGESAYIDFWEETLLKAAKFSKLQHKQASGYNVFSRFLTVSAIPNLGIELFLTINKWNENTRVELENAITDAIATVGQNYGQVTFNLLSHQQFQNAQGLIELPSHPLGFYKTYATARVIDALAGVRIGNERWIRDFPQDLRLLAAWRDRLMKDSGDRFWKKMMQVRPKTTTESILPRGAVIDSTKRAQTERIMGTSANKVGVILKRLRTRSDRFSD